MGIFDRQQEKFRYLNTDSTFGKVLGHINALLEDSNGTLWIGSSNGLYCIDSIRTWEGEPHPKLKMIRYRHILGDTSSISNNLIWCIYEDPRGDIWIGTNVGLNRFKKEDEKFTHFFKPDGLPSDVIYNIVEDDHGNLWLSTPIALCKVDLSGQSIHFKKYDASDGLPNNNLARALYKRRSGEILVGMTKGLIGFFPDSLKDNPNIPSVAITDLKIHNQSIPLDTIMNHKRHIVLSHSQNFFSLEFAALEFTAPERNQYAYLLEEFETDWNYSGNRRLANYTNVSPGSYIFRVKASNNDGVWNEKGTALKITILPPWWKTWWAYSIYAALILGTLYGLRRYELSRQRFKHRMEMEHIEAENLKEIDNMKSRFFANISHEFRTPLTLIFGPAKDISEKSKDKDIKQSAKIIKRNADKLNGLVNQLLDLSKLEAGKMALETSEHNIIPLLKGLVLSFSSLAERKKITLKFNTKEDKLDIYIDIEKLEKIITNLLSNAFKFTPEGGEVVVSVSKPTPATAGKPKSPPGRGIKGVGPMSKVIEISIQDTGIGIPKERLDKIFDRFYQVDGSHTRESEGTGIGLALTKELVELHKGTIKVESKEGEGTTFTVLLPLGREHLKADEIVEKEIEKEITQVIDETEIVPENEGREEKTDLESLLDTEKPLLLIVEDNSDVRNYIISHLNEEYRIKEAANGEDGLNKSIEQIPDLIVSDVMMPKMDGFELCEKIKTDERTSHIPVILLTAKATSMDKREGYETGADDYIMKPFDASELKVRIQNLIEIRRKLQEKFSSDDFNIPPELKSIDKEFLKKILTIVNEHISEEEFSIEELGKEAAMSRRHLHRKLKALTNKSPSQFVRSIRLSKARNLIKGKKWTISEISYQVGFSSPIYFNKCFKEEFGYSPSELVS